MTMTFSEFAQLLYPHCGGGASHGDYVTILVEYIMREPESDEEEDSDDKKEYNPVQKLEENTRQKIYNGTRPITKDKISTILGRLDKERFAVYIELSTTDDALNGLCKELATKFEVETTPRDVGQVCADTFEQILIKSASAEKKSKNINADSYVIEDEPYSDACAGTTTQIAYQPSVFIQHGNNNKQIDARGGTVIIPND